jgi:hypothetical protein
MKIRINLKGVGFCNADKPGIINKKKKRIVVVLAP